MRDRKFDLIDMKNKELLTCFIISENIWVGTLQEARRQN